MAGNGNGSAADDVQELLEEALRMSMENGSQRCAARYRIPMELHIGGWRYPDTVDSITRRIRENARALPCDSYATTLVPTLLSGTGARGSVWNGISTNFS